MGRSSRAGGGCRVGRACVVRKAGRFCFGVGGRGGYKCTPKSSVFLVVVVVLVVFYQVGEQYGRLALSAVFQCFANTLHARVRVLVLLLY